MLLLVAMSVAVCLALTVRGDIQQSQCGTPKVSLLRASYRTVKNSSGHWIPQVDFKQGQPVAGNEWSADFDQNMIISDGEEPILQTVVYIEAPPQGSSPLVSSPLWYSHVVIPLNKPTSTTEVGAIAVG